MQDMCRLMEPVANEANYRLRNDETQVPLSGLLWKDLPQPTVYTQTNTHTHMRHTHTQTHIHIHTHIHTHIHYTSTIKGIFS